MKTAGSGNPNRRATVPSNRAHGAEGQTRSCSITWAAKRENGQPLQMCFFLTSPFIELTRHLNAIVESMQVKIVSFLLFETSVTTIGTVGKLCCVLSPMITMYSWEASAQTGRELLRGQHNRSKNV